MKHRTASYTLVCSDHERTPEGYRREIARLRRCVEENPDDQGYRTALAAAEGTLYEIENLSDEERQRLLANLRSLTRRPNR
jgi:alpha-ketoglutarate-dependent taurine dioxygenase